MYKLYRPCHGCRPRQVRTWLFHLLARRRRCATWLNARTPRRASINTEHVLTHSRAQKCRLDGLFESGRTCIFDESLWCLGKLVVELTVASSQWSVERGSTVGRCGRVVATRRPVSGGTWYVPESSRTSGLSAGSGDLKDRQSTADTCLVLLRSVGSPGARMSSGDLCKIVGWQWRTIERRRTFSCSV